LISDDIAASYRAERETLRLRNIFFPFADTSYALPAAAMILIGGLFYLHGLVSLAAVTAAVLYAAQLLGPADQLVFWANELQSSGASLARLLGVERLRAPQAAGAASAPAPAPARSDFVVHDVRYAYPGGHDVLRGIDLTIRQGEWLAVVGPSGAGKSTLAKLLAGIYEPRTGSITISGTKIGALTPAVLRRKVSLVTQEHHVFLGSLRDNLAIAKPDATEAEMIAALTAVDAWDWARDLGLDSAVGSGGQALNPAQVQQLALARLILVDPDTLILDEATSLLSPGAARHLERSLAAVVRGRTVLTIVHRLHTARDADRIVVLEDGRITELGSHAELVSRNGSYATLWQAWQGPAADHSR
jgi:ABC-type multidrug transport system fused ATPase/permease subunit